MAELLRMQEATALGLHAAVLVAIDQDRALSMGEMAAALKASEAHLAKVLQTLVHAGILESKRGPGGGYRLAKPGGEQTLLDVYRAFEGDIREDGCLFAKKVCTRASCTLGDLVVSVRSQVHDYLRNTTLEDAAKDQGAQQGQ